VVTKGQGGERRRREGKGSFQRYDGRGTRELPGPWGAKEVYAVRDGVARVGKKKNSRCRQR